MDADPFLRNFLVELLDHFGVRIKEHEEGDVFLDPSHAYIEGFPSIPHDGMLATFNRQRAIVREDIRFIRPDHSLVQDAIDLLIDSKAARRRLVSLRRTNPTSCSKRFSCSKPVADSRCMWISFSPPTPVRVVVDVRGNDLTDERKAASLADDFVDATIQRFLERPSFNIGLLKTMLGSATERAEERTRTLKAAAMLKASTVLSADCQRLVDLKKLNDHVRPEEIQLADRATRAHATGNRCGETAAGFDPAGCRRSDVGSIGCVSRGAGG